MGNNIGGYQLRSSLPFVSTWCLHHSFASQTSLSDLHPNLIYPSINSSPIEPIFGVSDWTREPILPGETPPPTPPLHAFPAALTPPEPPIRLKRGLTDKPNHAPSFTKPHPLLRFPYRVSILATRIRMEPPSPPASSLRTDSRECAQVRGSQPPRSAVNVPV